MEGFEIRQSNMSDNNIFNNLKATTHSILFYSVTINKTYYH